MEEKYNGIDQRKWFCPWCGEKQYYESDSMGGRIPTEENRLLYSTVINKENIFGVR